MAELLVKDAEKWFRREDGRPFKIIDRLSFEAREGCVTVLIGPSGCGKSTLLNSMVGLENLDRGELILLVAANPRSGPLSATFFKARDCCLGKPSAKISAWRCKAPVYRAVNGNRA